MGLSLMGVVISSGSFNLREIVEAQKDLWFFIPQFLGLVVFLIAGFYEWASVTAYNGLTIAFMTAIAITLARGLNPSCGCFHVDPDAGKMTWLTFLRDASFLIPGLVSYLLLFRLRRPPIFKQRSVHNQLQ